MLEKWMLVVLIIGCTSLIFIICFPIDFYLYRRRKRMARKRLSNLFYQPQETCRAGQIRSRISIDISIDDYQEYIEKVQPKTVDKHGQLQNKFVRLINLFRREKKGKMLQMQRLSVSTTSEMKSEIPTVTLTTEQYDVDKGLSVSSLSTCRTDDNCRESQNNIHIAGAVTGETVADIEDEKYKTNPCGSPVLNGKEFESRKHKRKQNSHYYKDTNRTDDRFYHTNYNQLSVTTKQTQRVNIEIKECIVDDKQHNVDRDTDDGLCDDNTDIAKDRSYLIKEKKDSNLEIIEVQSTTRMTGNESSDEKSNDFLTTVSISEEGAGNLYIKNEHDSDQRFRKLKSEPNLNLDSNTKARDSGTLEPLTIAYSEQRLNEDINHHRQQLMYDLRQNNIMSPTDDESIHSVTVNDGNRRKKKKTKHIGESEDAILRNLHKRKKKKTYLQRAATSSLPEISITDNRDNFSRHMQLLN